MSHVRWLLLLLAGCSSRQPLPSGPPPEYETPRSYEPKTNIDKPGAEPDAIDKLLEEKPPEAEPAPAAEPAPPAASAPPPAPE